MPASASATPLRDQLPNHALLDQGGAAARRRVRRSRAGLWPWEARPARPRRPSQGGGADLAG